MDKPRLRIRGCLHEPPHPTFAECSPDNDAWMWPGSNVPVPDPDPPVAAEKGSPDAR